jgi:hypothetical protein
MGYKRGDIHALDFQHYIHIHRIANDYDKKAMYIPAKFGKQEQLNESIPSKHSAPLRQGLELQSSQFI